MNIREATLNDAKAIAEVHVSSWQTTYKGLMPDKVIASRTIEIRTKHAQSAIEDKNTVVLVAEIDGVIVGFATGGKPQYEDVTYDCEIYAIYLIAEAQGQGVGRALVQAFVQRALDTGNKSMMLWVLANNDASRGFYEKLGGIRVDRGKYQVTREMALETIAYGWHDIQNLIETS